MGCARWRELLSTQLDGEDAPGEREAAQRHLTSCDTCRRWYDDAAAITRRARMTLVRDSVDVTEGVLAALAAGPRRHRWWGLRALR
ncbi:zf-HC2 domain-containing protein [Micromonospora maritima]|uniref:Zf-HC2 domain-containing protein n=1 Tax=Micromonospora maritima TaxID=986711 RepID=A0ABW7ZM98_9ACTN